MVSDVGGEYPECVMKKVFALSSIFLVLCLYQAIGQPAKHVVLITIDGFRPEFYLDASWGAVNLRQLMQEGAYAGSVNGIFPTVTFAAHTTLITGVKPGKHGVYYNTPFKPNGFSTDWYWYFDAIKSPTLWEAVRNAGLTTGSVLWPVSAGAPIDYNIPDIWEAGKSDRRDITKNHASPRGLWNELEDYATGKMEANDFNLDKDYLSMDENVARMAAFIIRKYKPALTTVHLPAVDHAEHANGRDGDQVRRAVAGADRSVRTIVEAVAKAGITERTAIIITGDHGFIDRHTNFYPNVLLAQANLIGDVSAGQWKARFHTSGGAAFLYLKDQGDTKTLAKVKAILAGLPVSQKELLSVIEGEKLIHAGTDPQVKLAMSAAPGIAFGASSTGELLRDSRGGSHGYYPDLPGIQTGFIASGAGFKKGNQLKVIDMMDIAPLIAKLLGVDFKQADGTVHHHILTE